MATITGAIEGALRRPRSYEGLWSWITTVDHKRIGILYGVSALIFLLVGGAEALFMRLQLTGPNQSVVSPEVYNQLFTMHALTMIFLVVMPLSASFFNFIVPLQIGARDVAFPRLNALSYWVFLFGGLLLNAGWLVGASPDAGWFAYANLTDKPFSPGSGMDFYILGLLVLGISSVAAALNFIVTIINMRAPGMSLMRMPVFVWMTLVTSILLVTAFPVITVALIELMFDRFFGTNFFNVGGGGGPLLWQHLFWLFGHPEVYILILPPMGIVSEVLPTFSRKPLFGYPVVVLSGIIIGFMGWGVWAHHMFTVGFGPVANTVFALTTMAIAIPTGVKIFNWIATLWGGSVSLKTPMLFALGFIALFIIGGLSGVMHSAAPSDAQQQDTYFIVAHLHYVLFGGSIFAIFAGIYYWFPKITGRMIHDGLGKINFWLMFIGMNITFFPMHFLGLNGMPRRVYTYDSGMGWDFWNLVSTVGSFLMAASVLVFAYNVIYSLRRREMAGADPYDGRTLEWAIPSPPPVYNFEKIPTVSSRDAWWAQKYEGKYALPAPEGVEVGREGEAPGISPSEATDTSNGPVHPEHHQEEGHHGIHMPAPSYYPIVVAIGLALAAGLLIINHWLVPIGMAITVFALYGWAREPVSPPAEAHDSGGEEGVH